MNINSLLLLGCGLALHAVAQAQGPADPDAAVPPAVYRSVFPAAQGNALAAPGDWRRLNAEVGQFENGHMDIIKWEARKLPAAEGPIPAVPETSPTGHGHRHGMHGGSGHGSHPPGGKP